MCFIGETLQRNRFFAIACLLFCVSFLFAQDEISQPVLDWRQTLTESVSQRDYQRMLDAFQQVSNASDAEQFCLVAEQIYTDMINKQSGSEDAFYAHKNLLFLHISNTDPKADLTMEQFRAAFADQPLFIRALREAADVYFYVGHQPGKAQALYEEILKEHLGCPEAIWAQRGLAMAALETGQLTAAREAAEALLLDYSNHPQIDTAARIIADRFFYANDLSTARRLYEWIADRGSGIESIWVQRGLVMTCLRKRDYAAAEEALAVLQADFTDHPQFALALREAADEYFYWGRNPTLAQALYEQILRDQPEGPEAIWAQRGLILTSLEVGDKASADRELEILLSRHSNHPQIATAIRIAADRHFYVGKDSSTACRLYERILRDWPNSPEAMEAQRGLSMARINLGEEPAGVAAAETLLVDFEDHPDVAQKTAEAIHQYCRAGRTAEAIALSEQILSQNPSRAMELTAYANLAQAYVQLREDPNVREIVDLILTNFEEEKQIGYSLYLIGEEYYNRGLEEQQKGEVKQARYAFERAAEISDESIRQNNNPDHLYMSSYVAGLSHWQLGQWFAAADAFLDAIDSNPRFEYAVATHRLVSECYENLKRDGAIPKEEADPVIEWGYQTVFDRYPQESSFEAEHAALRLGEINLARGRPATACVYFNWFLDQADVDDGRIGMVRRILEGMEGCR